MEVYGDFFNQDDDTITMTRLELRKHSIWVWFFGFVTGLAVIWVVQNVF